MEGGREGLMGLMPQHVCWLGYTMYGLETAVHSISFPVSTP